MERTHKTTKRESALVPTKLPSIPTYYNNIQYSLMHSQKCMVCNESILTSHYEFIKNISPISNGYHCLDKCGIDKSGHCQTNGGQFKKPRQLVC